MGAAYREKMKETKGYDDAHAGGEASSSSSRAGASSKEVAKAKAPSSGAKAHDPKFLQKVESTLQKYEEDTWANLLDDEEQFLHDLFAKFDKTGKGEELDAMAYHQMLAKWFPLANWCSPGNFRAQDTLAVINYLRKESNAGKPAEPEKKEEKKDEKGKKPKGV